MGVNYSEIQELLQKRADYQARLNLMPYDGTPEVKEQGGSKYLYIRKRIAGKLTSTYVDVYSDTLYQLLLRNAKEARELKKEIRKIDRELSALGYEERTLSARIMDNLAFARANMKADIYGQAVLEGVAVSFSQTEDIIDNGRVNGIFATDVQKILNLKYAWEFVLDKDVIQSDSNYDMLCYIAKLVNAGFYYDGGRIRGVPVTIGKSLQPLPVPVEAVVMGQIDGIRSQNRDAKDIAIALCLYCMKTQVFTDGNKSAALIFANHYLIAHGSGLLVISEQDVPEFKKLLTGFYEGESIELIRFMKERCWKTF